MKYYLPKFIYIISTFLLCSLVSGGHNYRGDYYWNHAPYPELSVQKEEIYEVIADSLLSSDLDSIAVVRARPNTFKYLQDQNQSAVWLSRYAFHYDCLFVALDIYAESALSDIIAVIQPNKRIVSTAMSAPRPRNFRKNIFEFNGQFYLTFLSYDHILNYAPDYSQSSIRDSKELLAGVVGKRSRYEGMLKQLELNAFTNSIGMYSLVEKYSSFKIDGLPEWRTSQDVDYVETDRLTSSDQYILPSDFIGDLRTILNILSSGSMSVEDVEFATEDGNAVWAKLVSKMTKKQSDLNIDAELVLSEFHSSAIDDILVSIEGRVLDEEQKPIESAVVNLFGPESLYGDGCRTDDKGMFKLQTIRSRAAEGRLCVYTINHAPSFVRIDKGKSASFLEVALKKGQPVHFNVKFQDVDNTSTNGYGLALVNAKYAATVYRISLGVDKSLLNSFNPKVRSENDPLLLLPETYLLFLVRDDGGYAFVDSRYIDGGSQKSQDVIITPEIMEKIQNSKSTTEAYLEREVFRLIKEQAAN